MDEKRGEGGEGKAQVENIHGTREWEIVQPVRKKLIYHDRGNM